jgi:hypothetical protein
MISSFASDFSTTAPASVTLVCPRFNARRSASFAIAATPASPIAQSSRSSTSSAGCFGTSAMIPASSTRLPAR